MRIGAGNGAAHPAGTGGAVPRSMARILVADDLPPLRRLLRLALEGAGHAVLEAADGEQALAAAVSHRPHLAILDVRMPRRTGLEVCRAIRRQPAMGGTRVIVATGNGLPADAADARAAGADAFLEKPLRMARLLDLVIGLTTEAAAR